MSKISLVPNASGTGTLSIASPSTNSDYTLTLPAETGTVLTSASSITQNAGPAFSAKSGSNQTASAGVNTTIIFGTEDFDTNNCYDASTGTFTPTVAGYYQLNASVESNNPGADTYYILQFYKNGSWYSAGTNYPCSASAGPIAYGSVLLYMNGSTDYVRVHAQRQNAATFYSGNGTRFNGALVRAA